MTPETRSLLHRSAVLHRATVSLLEILAEEEPKRRTGELAGEIRRW